MRQFLLINILLVFTLYSKAQNLNTVKIMPSIGDTVFSSNYKDEIKTNYMDRGGDRLWNFNFIKTPYVIYEIYSPATKGKYFSSFPDASMVLLKANNEEIYYKKIGGEVYCLGEIKQCTFNKSGLFLARYNPARKMITKTMQIGNRYENDTEYTIALSKDDFIGKFSAMPFGADSMRLIFKLKQSTVIDDYGTLIISGEKYKVVKHTSANYVILETKIKSKYTNVWTTERLDPSSLPEELQSLISHSRYNIIEYFTEEYKGAFISYKLKDDKVSEFSFQNKHESEENFLNYNISGDVLVYPNPTYGEITLDLINMPRDKYTMEVYNIIGKKLWTVNFDTYNSNSYATELSSLRKGTYLYSIINSKGKKILTRRIAIVSI